MRNVFLFSGQGSHYYQMGRDLFEQHAAFRKRMFELESLIRDVAGFSVLESIYDPARKPSDWLDRTPLTHAAIFMIECSLTYALETKGVRPDFVVGSSLGSFAAAVAAGCIGDEDAVSALLTHAGLCELHCQRGGMISIVGQPKTWVEAFAKEHGCEMAAANDASPSVIAGSDEPLQKAESKLRKTGSAYQKLAVSYAFHSRWIDPAEKPYRDHLKRFSYRPARIPVVCSAHAQIHTTLPDAFFWDAARQPIRFEQAIARLNPADGLRFIDAGPSGTLATALKYWFRLQSSEVEVHSILTPFGAGLKRFQQVTSLIGTH